MNSECIHNYIMNDLISDDFIIKKIKDTDQININWKTGNHTFVDDKNRDKWTFLMAACYKDRVELVRYLLSHPELVINLLSDYFWDTALHIACIYNRFDCVNLLLKNPFINVNNRASVDHSLTALHYACIYGHILCAKLLLLDSRVDVGIISDYAKSTPERCAIQRGHYAIGKMICNSICTCLLRIPNASLCKDIIRTIIIEYICPNYESIRNLKNL